MMPDHAKCSVCGSGSELLSWPSGVCRVSCAHGGCVTGPIRTSVEAAWAAWDKLHGPRIPDEIKAVIQAEVAFSEVDSTDNLYHLHSTIDALTPEILRACGIDPEAKR